MDRRDTQIPQLNCVVALGYGSVSLPAGKL